MSDESAGVGTEEIRRRRALRRPRNPLAERASPEGSDRVAARLAQQWSQMRDERRAAQATPIIPAPAETNYRRGQVPYGVDLAAAYGWRFLIIVASTAVIAYGLAYLSELTIPLVIALLVTALVAPLVDLQVRLGLPRGLASLVVVLLVIAVVAALLTLAGSQIASGAQDLADQISKGLGEILDYLRDGPLHVSDAQINDLVSSAQQQAAQYAEGRGLGQVTQLGTAVTRVFAGLFITLLSTYFFLADGNRIWSWLVRLTPRTARVQVDGSGRVAWISLTQFVRATVIVAFVDAVGICIIAAVLQVPFVLAIGVLVFLGAFVPLVGATVAGSVAVLVALVDQGPVAALLMLAGVILVQQIEAHGLQPFLMGRWVSVHPLGVIVAIATGIIVGGVAGALVAVPTAAALNAVVTHLAAGGFQGSDPVSDLAEDYAEDGSVDVADDPLAKSGNADD